LDASRAEATAADGSSDALSQFMRFSTWDRAADADVQSPRAANPSASAPNEHLRSEWERSEVTQTEGRVQGARLDLAAEATIHIGLREGHWVNDAISYVDRGVSNLFTGTEGVLLSMTPLSLTNWRRARYRVERACSTLD
jgi:hypothetical protein